MEEFIAQLFVDFKSDEDEFFVNTDAWRQLSGNLALSLTETFNQLGAILARMYNKGNLNYEFCDALVNMAWSDWLDPFNDEKGNTWPADFYEVYEAFDAGEYYRTDDKSDDPISDHTNPLIRDFLKRVKFKA